MNLIAAAILLVSQQQEPSLAFGPAEAGGCEIRAAHGGAMLVGAPEALRPVRRYARSRGLVLPSCQLGDGTLSLVLQPVPRRTATVSLELAELVRAGRFPGVSLISAESAPPR